MTTTPITTATSPAITGRADIGVLITNLGTPDAPTTGALRRYLRQFLSDPRVVDAPRWLWWPALNGIILNVRPRRSAAAYRKVWTAEGSPLLLHTRAQAQALGEALAGTAGPRVKVAFAMRYGSPAIGETIQALWDQGARRLLVLPLYPQYSGPTTASTFDALAQDLGRRRWLPEVRFVGDYHRHPAYIAALADSVREHWRQHPRAERLLLSFHSMPRRYVDRGDPYYDQCLATSRALAAALGLAEHEWTLCFQSRFGREPWLEPYTDATLRALPEQGVRSVEVICPGFSADCLETIEEIGMENRACFVQAGGERYDYIPCLNSSPPHIEALRQVVMENLAGWLDD
ncbi:MAG: ferrochelatase [Parahaliea sp.]